MDKELELEAINWIENTRQHISVKTGFIAGATSKYVEKQKEKLMKERDIYKKAYEELYCYFNSTSDEEQIKIAKRLKIILKKLNNESKTNKTI